MKTVDISPSVALKEAQAEISYLRNRNLILAQGLEDLQRRIMVAAPTEPANLAGENPA